MMLIAPSQWLADLAQQSTLGEYPVQVIHNTIDTEIFKPVLSDFRERYGLEKKKIVLGVASVWSARKGLDDFLQLAQMLDSSCTIVLVGLSKKQIQRLPNGVIGIQRTNNVAELCGIYSTADVFVNPTYEDTYPTTNLEAQACGTPCITYRTGGSPESVPGENVIETGDVGALARRILEVVEKNEKNLLFGPFVSGGKGTDRT